MDDGQERQGSAFMSAARTLVAVSLDQDRLCAVGATVSAKGVEVSAFVSAQAPQGMNIRDAAAVGAWIGAELGRAVLCWACRWA